MFEPYKVSVAQALQPAVFRWQDKEFLPLVQTRLGIFGWRSWPGKCCVEILGFQRGEAAPCFHVPSAPHGPPARRALCSHIAELLTNPDFDWAAPVAAWPIPGMEAHGIVVPPLDPAIVPGTSEGVTYHVLARTAIGTVSRRTKDPSHLYRIRVGPLASLASYVNMAKGDHSLSDENEITWESAQATHLAHNGKGQSNARIIVARGIDLLLQMQTGL